MKYTELYFKLQIIGGIICFAIVIGAILYFEILGKIKKIKNLKVKKNNRKR